MSADVFLGIKCVFLLSVCTFVCFTCVRDTDNEEFNGFSVRFRSRIFCPKVQLIYNLFSPLLSILAAGTYSPKIKGCLFRIVHFGLRETFAF